MVVVRESHCKTETCGSSLVAEESGFLVACSS